MKHKVLYFIIIVIFTKNIKPTMFLSFVINSVDDCIAKIYKTVNYKNLTLFENKQYEDCEASMFFNDLPKTYVYNTPYNFNEIIYVSIYDIKSKKNNNKASVNITTRIDEYTIIQTCFVDFWNCSNCIKEAEHKFYCESNEILLYKKLDERFIYGGLYYLEFNINSQDKLNNVAFKVDNEFYFLNQKKYNFTIGYEEDELELINFNTTETFYRKDNSSLLIDYKNYYFKINFNDKEYDGCFLGLNLMNEEMCLKNGEDFKITNNKGLRYKLKLSSIEKIYFDLNLFIYL